MVEVLLCGLGNGEECELTYVFDAGWVEVGGGLRTREGIKDDNQLAKSGEGC